MNYELAQQKIDEYWRTTSPEQVIAEFEALGVVFEDGVSEDNQKSIFKITKRRNLQTKFMKARNQTK